MQTPFPKPELCKAQPLRRIPASLAPVHSKEEALVPLGFMAQ